MEKTCTTIQGETWDEIAYRVYLDILVFSAGTVLQTPDLPEESGASLPSWRTEARAAAGDPYSV